MGRNSPHGLPGFQLEVIGSARRCAPKPKGELSTALRIVDDELASRRIVSTEKPDLLDEQHRLTSLILGSGLDPSNLLEDRHRDERLENRIGVQPVKIVYVKEGRFRRLLVRSPTKILRVVSFPVKRHELLD